MKKFLLSLLFSSLVVTPVLANNSEVNVISKTSQEMRIQPKINQNITKAINTQSWTTFVSDNNVLNETVTITYAGVPGGHPNQNIIVKVMAGSTTLLSDTNLSLGDNTAFSIPWNGGKYSVMVKGTQNGSVTINVSDR